MIQMNCMYRTLLAAVVLAFSSVTASADTIYVSAGGDILGAINQASNGDVIQLEAGLYQPSATIDTIGRAITLRGVVGLAGQPISVIDGQNKRRVLQCFNGELADTVFENLVIQNGYSYNGGGMYNDSSSSPTLTNCTFRDNSADDDGGGMYMRGSPTVVNCTFRANVAGFRGGAVYSRGDGLFIDCTIEENFAGHGGGVYYSRNLTFNGCTVSENHSAIGGGIMADPNNFEDNLVLAETIVCGNTPDQVFGAWIDDGGACVAFSCETWPWLNYPHECDFSGPNILYVPQNYTIAGAVAAAEPGAVIQIAAGTYTPDSTIDFQGKSLILRGAVDDSGMPATVLDGRDEIRLLQSNGGEATSELVIENLVIRNGNALPAYRQDAQYGGGQAGGMFLWHSNASIRNCVFEGCTTGALAAYYSRFDVNECVFVDNSTWNDGVGIFAQKSSVILMNSEFRGNTGGFNGGAGVSIYQGESSAVIEGCVFAENASSYHAGALLVNQSSASIRDCEFIENTSAQDGGAIHLCASSYYDSTVTLEGCFFEGNLASGAGNAIRLEVSGDNPPVPSMAFCTFTECCQVVPPRSFVDAGGNDYDSWCDDCRADVNCRDDAVNAADLGILIGSWGTIDPQCDINDDGTVDAADLGLLIGAWGPCQ